MPAPKLILASSSPQRRRLLEEAGYRFEVVAPHPLAEHGVCSQCGPAELVVELAAAKAIDVASQLRGRASPLPPVEADVVVLACDTVAECGGEILGKPRDEDHARAMLERLRGQRHRVYSGVCVRRLGGPAADGDRQSVRLAVSELLTDRLNDEDLDEYLASGLWRNKAGAFGFQDREGWLHLVSGTEENVIGLPLDETVELLAAEGVLPGAS
jgi:septum formation protein